MKYNIKTAILGVSGIHQASMLKAAGWVLLAIACVFIGLLSALLPWWLAMAFVIGPILATLVFLFPHYGLIFALLLIFNVLPRRFVPKLPIGPGGLEAHDVIILILTFSLLCRTIYHRLSIRKQLGPYFIPLLYVGACVLVSMVYVKLYAPNPFVLTEARNYIAWLLLPIAAISFDSSQKYRTFLQTLFVIGLIVAIAVIFQSLTGINFLGGRVEILDRYNSDVTRSTAGGGVYIIIFSIYLTIGAAIAGRIKYYWLFPIITVLLGGLLVTFGRAVWIAAFLGLLVSMFLQRGVITALLAAGAVFVIAIASVSLLSLSNPRMTAAVAERFFGITAEMQRGNSFQFRVSEAREAFRAIQNRPLTGVGLGGEYKRVVTSADTFEGETRYIHNSYLLLALKMGLHALLIPVLFIGAAIMLLRKCFQGTSSAMRFIPAAASGAICVPIITSFTQPEWGVLAGICSFCCFMVIPLLHFRYHSEGTPRQSGQSKQS